MRESSEWFPEELRSKQPTVFSALRAVCAALRSSDPYLGFYGAFGYELAFQFEPVRQRLQRDADQRDLVLYLPDEILIVDHRREQATTYCYEFEIDGASSKGMPRDGAQKNLLLGCCMSSRRFPMPVTVSHCRCRSQD